MSESNNMTKAAQLGDSIGRIWEKMQIEKNTADNNSYNLSCHAKKICLF